MFGIHSYRLPFRYQLVAHRGGKKHFPENSIAAFKNAIKLEADVLELDVQLTKDNQVVVFHDRALLKLTGKEGRIRDFEYKELPRLQIDTKLYPGFGKTKLKDEWNRIPLLQDVFKISSGIPIFLDFKTADEPELFVNKVNSLIKEYDRETLTIWASLPHHFKIHQLLSKTNPKIKRFFSGYNLIKTWVLYWTCVLPFTSSFHDHVFVAPVKFLQLPFLSSMLVHHLNSRGVPVVAFRQGTGAVNTLEEYEECMKMGVNGLCTDDVELCLKYIHEVVKKRESGDGITSSTSNKKTM